MGQGASAAKNEPPKVVLVPPLFERDLKGRSRFTHSSYEYMFSKRSLKWLFQDYLDGRMTGKLYLSPHADPRISVKAKLSPATGSMCVRWQPDVLNEGTFLDIRAAPQAGGDAAVRMSFLHPASGVGLFGKLPLAGQLAGKHTEIGIRYSSSLFSCGAILLPQASTATLSTAWMAARYKDISLGAQVEPQLPINQLAKLLEPSTSSASALGAAKQSQAGSSTTATSSLGPAWVQNSSICLAYSPLIATASGRGSFTASAEVTGGDSLTMGFYQHMALTRNIYNPLEKEDVVGITNYLDLGIRLTTPLSDSSTTAPNLQIAGSWQVNRGLLAKARVGSDSCAIAVAVKAWGHPSLSVAACTQYTLGSWQPRIGLYIQVENCGGLLFERSDERWRRGSAVTQEHEAFEEEVASAAGHRVQYGAGLKPGDYNTKISNTSSYL